MDVEQFQASQQAGGAHHQLGLLVGTWEGITQTWFEPGVLADESPTRGVIRPILGGRFVMYEYEGSLMGEPMQGVAIYGYHTRRGLYEAAWMDNCHLGNGMMFSQGPAITQGFGVLGAYDDPTGGPPWGWRTEVQLVGEDQLVITMYNIAPTGEEAKGVETVYTRQKLT